MVADSQDNDAVTAAAPGGGGFGKLSIIALVLALVLAPAITWALSEFVLLPRMRSAIVTGAEPAAAARAPGGQSGKAGFEASAHEGNSYRFDNLVVNLAGTMGTRYLKTSFIVTSDDPHLNAIFTAEQVRLRDAALSVLSSLTLADLEEVGARNFIRERLVRSFNQALGQPVAGQIYFLDFVVQ